jgi:type I restriction enzyme S subunit
MSEWRQVKIGDICQVGDGAHAKVKRQVSGIPYLTSKNFGRGKLKLDDVDFISEQDYERLFSKGVKSIRRPQDGDVLMGIIGTFGNGYRYKSSDKFGVSSSVAILRPNQTKLDPDFLEYMVNSKTFSLIHQAYGSGSVQGYTNIPTIKSMPIYLPPLEEQRRIAAVLSTLDAKIDLLRRQNHTLEQIVQTLFKRWFVEFEFPNEAGQPYLSNGGPMQPSELGEIPLGWRVMQLEKICKTIYRYPQFYGMEKFDSGVPVIRGEHLLPDGRIDHNWGNYWFVSGDYSEQFPRTVLKEFDVVLAVRGSVGKYSLVGKKHIGAQISPNTIRLSANPKFIFESLLFPLLKSNNFEKRLLKTVSSSAVPAINASEFKGFEFLIPNIETQKKLYKIFEMLYRKTDDNILQIQTLTCLRDTLLPKLMSGQIRVSD